jgi:hypothetical protein
MCFCGYAKKKKTYVQCSFDGQNFRQQVTYSANEVQCSAMQRSGPERFGSPRDGRKRKASILNIVLSSVSFICAYYMLFIIFGRRLHAGKNSVQRRVGTLPFRNRSSTEGHGNGSS